METPLLVVGRVAKAHGLRGEVSVVVVGDDPGRLAPGRELWYERAGEEPRRVTIAASRGPRERLLVRLEGVTTREDAERLAGGDLSIPFDASELREGEYYPHQLEGLAVVTPDGAEAGRVAGVVFAPGAAYLEITREGSSRTQLVPFLPHVVRAVDLATGRVTIEPPEGLLEL